MPNRRLPARLKRLGDFRIIREVGRGGMGAVFEAEQISLRRSVALKILRFGAVSDPESIERFKREAETVAKLHHTNIVPIFNVGSEHGVNYYAMQFIEGRSLAEVLAETAGTAPRESGCRVGIAGGRSAGPRASTRCHSPRRETVESLAGSRKPSVADRLRPGTANGRRHAEHHRSDFGNASLHESRTGRRGS